MSQSQTFIKHLCELAENADHDRAPLAALRRGASGEPRDLAGVYPLVLPWAPRGAAAQQSYLDLACLFGLHPTRTNDRGRAFSLAEAMSQLKGKSDSVEGRFVALLRSHPEELLAHVRHTVSLANSHDLLLRWDDVLNALLYWRQDNTAREDKPRRSPQRRWAQEFWSVESETQATASQPSA